MQVFVCDGCNKQHTGEDVENKFFDVCDGCKRPMGKSNYYRCIECYKTVYHDFHKACVTMFDGEWYCDVHKVVKERAFQAGKVIQKYAQEFWNELGGTVIEFKQMAGSLNRNFKVQFEALYLEVKLSAVTKNPSQDEDDIVTTDEIIALKHRVSGIKSYGSKTYKVSIHSHQDALEDVAGALIRSLRSKKSALTVEKKYVDSRYKHQLEWATQIKSWRKRRLHLQEAESNHKTALNVLATKRRKINKMSKMLAGKLAEFKDVREAKELIKAQEAVLV